MTTQLDNTTQANLNLCRNYATAYNMKFLSHIKGVVCIRLGEPAVYDIVVPREYSEWFDDIKRICWQFETDTSESITIRNVPENSYVYGAFDGQYTIWMQNIFDAVSYDALLPSYVVAETHNAVPPSQSAEELMVLIESKGAEVRKAKKDKVSKDIIDFLVKQLIGMKATLAGMQN